MVIPGFSATLQKLVGHRRAATEELHSIFLIYFFYFLWSLSVAMLPLQCPFIDYVSGQAEPSRAEYAQILQSDKECTPLMLLLNSARVSTCRTPKVSVGLLIARPWILHQWVIQMNLSRKHGKHIWRRHKVVCVSACRHRSAQPPEIKCILLFKKK